VQKEVENKMQEEYRLTLQMKYYSLGELDEGIFARILIGSGNSSFFSQKSRKTSCTIFSASSSDKTYSF